MYTYIGETKHLMDFQRFSQMKITNFIIYGIVHIHRGTIHHIYICMYVYIIISLFLSYSILHFFLSD